MQVIIDKKKFNLVDCTKFYSRFKGLMFTKEFDYCMRFERCNSIHTFFMYTPIDVVMTDKDNNVLFVFKNLKPNRIVLPKKGVYSVYEFPCGSIEKNVRKVKVL